MPTIGIGIFFFDCLPMFFSRFDVAQHVSSRFFVYFLYVMNEYVIGLLASRIDGREPTQCIDIPNTYQHLEKIRPVPKGGISGSVLQRFG